MRRLVAPTLLPTLGIILGLVSNISASAQTSTGWTQLWNDHIFAAGRTFRAQLIRHPSDTEALRGLGWTSYFTGDSIGVLRNWSKYITLKPQDPRDAELWQILTDTSDSVGRRDFEQLAAKSLAMDINVPSQLKLSAKMILANSADSKGQFQKGDAIRKSFGTIPNWKVIGPFDNVSKSGFDKSFAPETKIRLNATIPGLNELGVKWIRSFAVSRNGTCFVGSFLGPSAPGVYYAVNAVKLSAPTDAVLHIKAAGAVKMAVNGKLVLQCATYPRSVLTAADEFLVPVTLHAGTNTILLKLCDNSVTSAAFQVSSTDKLGRPTLFEQVNPQLADGTAYPPDMMATDPSAQQSQPWVFTSNTTPLGSIENAVLQGYAYQSNGDYEGGEAFLKSALVKFPDSAVLHSSLSTAQSADGLSDDSSAELKLTRTECKEISAAEYADYVANKSALSTGQQLAQLKLLTREFPFDGVTASDYAETLAQSGQKDAGAEAIRRVASEEGGSGGLLTLCDFDRVVGNYSAAEHIIRSVMAEFPYETIVLQEYIQFQDKMSNARAKIPAEKKLLEISPELVDTWALMAADYTDINDDKQALKLLQQLATNEPESADVQTQLAEAYLHDGERANCIACYARAVQLDPMDSDLRDKYQVLTGQTPVLDMVPAIPTPKLDIWRSRPLSSGVSSTYLVNDCREVVYPDALTVSEFHQVLKINNKMAVKFYQNFPIAAHSESTTFKLMEAKLIKPDGKTENRMLSDDSTDAENLTFPSLTPGDIIDVTYRRIDHATGALSHDFWSEWTFGGISQEVIHSRYVLISPEKMAYQTASHGGAPAPTNTVKNGWHIETWESKVPAVYDTELYDVPPHDSLPWIDVSTISSWQDIVRWYQDLSGSRCQPDAVVRAKAIELTQNLSSVDDKIRALYTYVSHDIEYQSSPFRLSAYVPTEGKDVVRERYGDCKDKAALLTAMLSTIGVKSKMVLLSPKTYGTTAYLPSPRFAHAIALVDTPKGKLWIDGTADNLAYGSLPTADQGVPALVIKNSTTGLETIPSESPADEVTQLDYTGTLSATGGLTSTITTTFSTEFSWLLRSTLARIPADQMDLLLRTMTSRSYKLDYDSGSVANLTDDSKPLTFNINGHSDTFASPAGSFLIMGMPTRSDDLKLQNDELSKPGRTRDVSLPEGSGTSIENVSITLPNGYQPEELPADLKINNIFGHYERTYGFHDSVLKIHEAVLINPTVIPVADLPKYIAFCKLMAAESDKKLVLKKI